MSWIAEDVPWYQIAKAVAHRPHTDEDIAMSAPIHLGEFDVEREARSAVHSHLYKISSFNHVLRAGESHKFAAAAHAILAGADGVRIDGRYYRVREV